MTTEHYELQNEYDELQDSHEQLQNEHEEIHSELNQLQEKYDELNNEFDELQTKHDKMQEELHEVNNKIDTLLKVKFQTKYRETQEIMTSIFKILYNNQVSKYTNYFNDNYDSFDDGVYTYNNDYDEIINSFIGFIDSEDFIKSHKLALRRREARLEEEYQNALQVYNAKYSEYENAVAKRKQKSFFIKIFSKKAISPNKPIKRW